MEKSIITTGKTIDEAIAAALAKLGMDRDSVSVTVLEQAKAGFFGIGRVDAKVQVTYEAPDLKPAAPVREEKPAAPNVALSSASRSKPKAAKPAPKAETPKPEVKPVEKKPEVKPEPKAEALKAEPKKASEKKPVEKKPVEKKPAEKKVERAPKAAPRTERTYAPAEPGSNEEKIEQFLKGLLENMGSQAVPHCWSDSEGSYRVELTGEGLGFLIGRRGETLDAIQHLANYAVNRSIDGHVRINVDAECYREKREDSLRRDARK